MIPTARLPTLRALGYVAVALAPLLGLALLVVLEYPCGGAVVYTDAAARPGAIAVVGDLQRTGLFERAFGREQNDAARARVVAAMAAEAPSLVVILGDLVGAGASCADWRMFDQVTAPLHALGVPVVPVLGNHDYWGPDALALRNFEARFPHAAGHRWSERRHDRLGLVWLDSNVEDLGPERWAAQRAWFVRTLHALDADPKVRGVLVFLHHPAFTNSAVTGDEAHVQAAFLDPFVEAHKSLAMLSGHAHTYEHFVERGKHFIVSGGGGGPRVKLLRGPARRHEDLYEAPAPRPFHFLQITENSAGVTLRARGVGEAGAARDIDRIEIAFPPSDE